jgi:hypothetical protein
LFHLCEARSNGDLSAEQYAAAVQSILKTMEQRAAQPNVAVQRRMRFDMDARRRWRKRHRFDGEPVRPEPEKKDDSK